MSIHIQSYFQEQIETVARIINELRSEHIAKGRAVREALAEEKSIILKNKSDQQNKIIGIENDKKKTRQKAEELGKNTI